MEKKLFITLNAIVDVDVLLQSAICSIDVKSTVLCIQHRTLITGIAPYLYAAPYSVQYTVQCTAPYSICSTVLCILYSV